MKYSYKYTMALLSFSTVVCVGSNCNDKKQQTPKEAFQAVWKSKGKDSTVQHLTTTLNMLEGLVKNAGIPPDQLASLKEECIAGATPQIDEYIEGAKEICLKLPDQVLKSLVDKLEKSKDVFQTLKMAAPESVKSEIAALYEKCAQAFMNNSLQLIVAKHPALLTALPPNLLSAINPQ